MKLLVISILIYLIIALWLILPLWLYDYTKGKLFKTYAEFMQDKISVIYYWLIDQYKKIKKGIKKWKINYKKH